MLHGVLKGAIVDFFPDALPLASVPPVWYNGRMGWKDKDMRTPDERTRDYFREKMESDHANKAFWSATAFVTEDQWHLDRWEGVQLEEDTLRWLEDENYFGATQPFEKDIVRRLVFLVKHNAHMVFDEICKRAQEMEKAQVFYTPGSRKGGLEIEIPVAPVSGTEAAPPPPPPPPPQPAPKPKRDRRTADPRKVVIFEMLKRLIELEDIGVMDAVTRLHKILCKGKALYENRESLRVSYETYRKTHDIG